MALNTPIRAAAGAVILGAATTMLALPGSGWAVAAYVLLLVAVAAAAWKAGGNGESQIVAAQLAGLAAEQAGLADKAAATESALRSADEKTKATLLGVSAMLEKEIDAAVGVVSERSKALTGAADDMRAQALVVSEQNRTLAHAADTASSDATTVATAAEELRAAITALRADAERSNTAAASANEQARRSSTIVAGLSEASQRIGAVVTLINDIAGQTNLLALNATIEAARAGDAGKGFAVVANEVKQLATQTAKATGDITAQVGAIQGAVGEAVAAIRAIEGTITQMSEISADMSATTGRQVEGAAAIASQARQAANATRMVSTAIVNASQTASEAEHMSELVLGTIAGVTGQLGGMRDRLVAALRGSEAGNRRIFARVNVDMAGKLAGGGTRQDARVRDLSLGGALLAPVDGVRNGAMMDFSVDTLQAIPAEVLRTDEKGLHLRFRHKPGQRRAIADLLGRHGLKELTTDGSQVALD